MLVEVIKPYVEHLGKKGTLRDIPFGEARIHVLLGNAVEVKAPRGDLQVETPVVRKKRAYRRRDLKAEE